MNSHYKPSIYGLFIAGLMVSATAWSESDCASQECRLLETQLELLRTELLETHSDIKQLEAVLNNAKQDIYALQRSGSNKLSSVSTLSSDSQYKHNGRGIRSRSAH